MTSKLVRMQQAAAVFLGFSAVLHLIGAAFGLAVFEGRSLVAIAVLYFVLASRLWRGARWAAYVVFIFMLIGGIGSWISSASAVVVPIWVYRAISLADFLCVLCLIPVLWSNRADVVTQPKQAEKGAAL
ncbi:MAG: hypothetical protein AB8F65_13285 [Woeseiaceae bacterium]